MVIDVGSISNYLSEPPSDFTLIALDLVVTNDGLDPLTNRFFIFQVNSKDLPFRLKNRFIVKNIKNCQSKLGGYFWVVDEIYGLTQCANLPINTLMKEYN